MSVPVPSLDHFVGRRVEKLTEAKDYYKIHMEGGVIIYSTRKLPDGLKDKMLVAVTLGETDTVAVFEDIRVELHPTKYLIETPEFKPLNPQMPPELQDVPEDPSSERITEGPESDPERSVLGQTVADGVDLFDSGEGVTKDSENA